LVEVVTSGSRIRRSWRLPNVSMPNTPAKPNTLAERSRRLARFNYDYHQPAALHGGFPHPCRTHRRAKHNWQKGTTMTEQTRTPVTTRIINIASRFVQAERQCCDDHIGWSEARRVDWSLFPGLPQARARTYVSGSLRRGAAPALLNPVQTWFGPHFRFKDVFLGRSDTQVDEQNLAMFEKMLRVHSFTHFNSALLKNLIETFRVRAKDGESVEEFKREVWDEGLGLMLDAATDYWDRPGAVGLINKVARELASLFVIKVNLMTEDETLEHMLIVLEEYADSYEAITKDATTRHRAAVAATAAR
jgi:hypothetical protein